MPMTCPLCQSNAGLSQQEARALVRVIGTCHGFLNSVPSAELFSFQARGHPHDMTLLDRLRAILVKGVAGVTVLQPEMAAFEEDVAKQFLGHSFLCLRCGATYDPESTSPAPDQSERSSRSQS